MTLPKILQDSLSIPVIGAPLFLVSGPELVIAQCKAGIVGSFPALNARPQHVLEEWLIRIKDELANTQVGFAQGAPNAHTKTSARYTPARYTKTSHPEDRTSNNP